MGPASPGELGQDARYAGSRQVLGDRTAQAANPQDSAAARSYTFGDADVAAQRLAVVNEVFGSTSRALLEAAVKHPPALAYDLGCGPGHSTRLVAQTTGAKTTVGLERSEAHLARAASSALEGTRFVAWDVTELPFPAGRADLIYARLLLAHLKDPRDVALSWTTQLREGGLLVVDARLSSPSFRPISTLRLRSPTSPLPCRSSAAHRQPGRSPGACTKRPTN